MSMYWGRIIWASMLSKDCLGQHVLSNDYVSGTIIMYSFLWYLSKLAHIAHYKEPKHCQNKLLHAACRHTHTHTHTHTFYYKYHSQRYCTMGSTRTLDSRHSEWGGRDREGPCRRLVWARHSVVRLTPHCIFPLTTREQTIWASKFYTCESRWSPCHPA